MFAFFGTSFEPFLEQVKNLKIISGDYTNSEKYSVLFLLGLRQLLATESPLKIMKNAFYFTLKALFVLKMFKFLS